MTNFHLTQHSNRLQEGSISKRQYTSSIIQHTSLNSNQKSESRRSAIFTEDMLAELIDDSDSPFREQVESEILPQAHKDLSGYCWGLPGQRRHKANPGASRLGICIFQCVKPSKGQLIYQTEVSFDILQIRQETAAFQPELLCGRASRRGPLEEVLWCS